METNIAKISKAFVIFDTWLASSKPQYHNADDFKKHYNNYINSFGGKTLNEEYNYFINEFLPKLDLDED